MRLSSSNCDLLGTPLFGSADVDAATDDPALVAAMLEAEAALAMAEADTGIFPFAVAEAIARACRDLNVDPAELGAEGASAGNPVPALVRRLGEEVPETAKPWVHYGATSQDIVDTALMLASKRALKHIATNVDGCGDACAELAEQHRETVMVGRTLGQPASPTTFGRKVAGWLVSLDDAAERVAWVCEQRIAVQLGGPVGTLAALGDRGDAVVGRFADRLGLQRSALPWHTDRSRILDVAVSAGLVGTTAQKIVGDILLMAQAEVGEVAVSVTGGSSAMPHKRNPIDAILGRAGGQWVPGLLATLFATADQRHERDAGGWHAEWAPSLELLRVVGGVALHTLRTLTSLSVNSARMRRNFDDTGGLVMAESVAARLGRVLGRPVAHELVARCADIAVTGGQPFVQVLLDDPAVSSHFTQNDVIAALEPGNWLGAAREMVDRAVDEHRRRRP